MIPGIPGHVLKLPRLLNDLHAKGHEKALSVGAAEDDEGVITYSLEFDPSATTAEIDAANADLQVELTGAYSELAWAKKVRKDEIDARTELGLAEGCYLHAGHEFPIDRDTLQLWNGILNSTSLITFDAAKGGPPDSGTETGFRVTRKDEGNHYVADLAELFTMQALFLQAVASWENSGAELKDTVEEQTTVAAVKAVADDR